MWQGKAVRAGGRWGMSWVMRAAALVLGVALALVPGTALAWDGNEYEWLKNHAIRVKFNNEYWYIIEDNSTALDAGTVTLLAADLNDYRYNESYRQFMGYKQCFFAKQRSEDDFDDYKYSRVRDELDYLAWNGRFAGVLGAIADTDLRDVGVYGAKLYLLSADEAKNLLPEVHETTMARKWWLRSRSECMKGWVAYVDYSGYIEYLVGMEPFWERLYIRPALRLKLDSVTYDPKEATFTLKSNSEYGDDPDPEPQATATMLRLYNPNSGEHLYTASVAERDHLVGLGWAYEGVAWLAPAEGDPVFRLYNPNAGEHHYTMDVAERDALVVLGWDDEGVGWCSDQDKGVAILREYNPNALACNHNYTTDEAEHDRLVSLGWKDEGVAWYGVAA